MEHYLSMVFAKTLLKKNIINRDLFEVYVYGTELFLSFLFTNIIIIIIGIIIEQVIPTLLHLLIFIIIRRFTGGYHASTYLKCKITMILIYALVIILANYTKINMFGFILLLLYGNFIIYIAAPVENPNKKLTDKQKVKFKKLSYIAFSITTGFGIILFYYFDTLGKTVFYSLTSVITLMEITLFKKGGTSNEKQSIKNGFEDHS